MSEARKHDAVPEDAPAVAPDVAPQDPPTAAEETAAESPLREPPPTREALAELEDRLLRTLAEMENLRARTRRDVEDARRYAVTAFARDLLEVADNLRRAVASAPPPETREGAHIDNLVQGVEMTEAALLSTFKKHQIRKVAPERGERFDHNLHQAMFEVPTETQPPGTIAEVMQAGYVIADRLLRPALVGVAKAPPVEAPAAPETKAPVD